MAKLYKHNFEKNPQTQSWKQNGDPLMVTYLAILLLLQCKHAKTNENDFLHFNRCMYFVFHKMSK